MNEHIHEVINKFNNINLACGALALELEFQRVAVDGPLKPRERIKQVLKATAEDLKFSRQLLAEIAAATSKEPGLGAESGHFIGVLEPILSIIETERLELKNIISGGGERPLPERDLIRALHTIEEKALASAIILKELRSALVKSGKYKVKGR